MTELNLVASLRATSCSAQKLVCIRSASIAWQDVLKATYDGTTYGVSFKSEGFQLRLVGKPTTEMFALLRLLATRKLSGTSARRAVDTFANANGCLIKLICNRDLDCGVNVTTINKAIPGLIYKLKAQKALVVPLEKIKFPCYAELKYDGVRLFIIHKNNEITFKTFNGKIVHLPATADHIANTLVKGARNWVLDCEVTVAGGKQIMRSTVTGLINSAIRGKPINEDRLEFNVFDFLQLTQFTACKCEHHYTARRHEALLWVNMMDLPQLKLAWQYRVKDQAELEILYTSMVEQGYEGLVVKRANSMYLFKRSAEWIKLKETKTADLQCTSAIDGQGKYAGEIGALCCEGTVEGREVFVKVGSGLTDHDRAAVAAEYIGKTIEIKYNSITKDSQTGQYSLFLPRFVCVREDK